MKWKGQHRWRQTQQVGKSDVAGKSCVRILPLSLCSESQIRHFICLRHFPFCKPRTLRILPVSQDAKGILRKVCHKLYAHFVTWQDGYCPPPKLHHGLTGFFILMSLRKLAMCSWCGICSHLTRDGVNSQDRCHPSYWPDESLPSLSCSLI